MPSKKPRIHALVDEPLYEAIEEQAEREGISLSRKARDLLKLAMEIQGDRRLDGLVDERKDSEADSIPHEAFWSDRT